MTDIIDITNKGHFQIACQRYFEARHNTSCETGINHPNQYFDESLAILSGTKTPSKGKDN